MERFQKRSPYGGSRYSYAPNADNRNSQAGNGRYTPAGYASGSRDYQSGYGVGQASRYSSARYAQPARGAEGIIDLLWRHRFYLFVTTAVLLTALVVVAVIAATALDNSNGALPYYTPAPSVPSEPPAVVEAAPADRNSGSDRGVHAEAEADDRVAV